MKKFALVFTLSSMFLFPSCSFISNINLPFGKKPTKKTSAPFKPILPPKPEIKKTEKTEVKEEEPQPQKEKLEDIGLKGEGVNFSKEVGKHDPFYPVNIDVVDWTQGIKLAPEKYRVAGVLWGEGRSVAVLEFGERVYAVEEGEIITEEKNIQVKKITNDSVILSKEGKTYPLYLGERIRTQPEKVEVTGKSLEELPDISLLYQQYLQNKFAEEKTGEGKPIPKSFQDYLKDYETNLEKTKEEEDCPFCVNP